jgi:hypothetical protein
MVIETNSCRAGRTCDVPTIATFGDAELVRHINGRYELCGGSVDDHTTALEWISLFLHEAVVSSPPAVAARRRLSELAPRFPKAVVRWARRLRTSHR